MTLHLSPEIIRMTGWALLHFLWQGAIVAALLSMTLAFCHQASMRYAAAVMALIVMVALPFGTYYFLQQRADEAMAFDLAADTSAQTPVVSTLGPVNGHHHSSPVSNDTQPELMLWLVRLWLVGVVVFSLRSAGGFLLVQRLRSVAKTPVQDDLLELCTAVQERMGISRAVKFCRSAALQVPAVVGGIRPIVLLPVSALTGLTDSQIEAIVAHELAHVRRLDYFVNLFQVFAETVLFYHPAVWWVNKRIRTERENCCDDTAISVCGNRLEYVHALTHLESVRLTPQFAMGADGSPLKARVRRLLGMSEEREGIRTGSSVLGVLVVAGLVLAASSIATGAKAQAANTTQTQEALVVSTPQEPIELNVDAEPVVVNVNPVSSLPRLADGTMISPMDVHVPAITVNVPPVNVQLPQMAHFAVPAMNVAVPAVHVAVPAISVHVPAIGAMPMLWQANGETRSNVPAQSYIDSMKAAGYDNLDVDQLVAMKIQGITPEYVREMKAAGMKMDADDLIGLKIQGVTPDYVKQMRAAYPGIDNDTIIGFKIQGVTTQYAGEMSKLGVKADPDDLLAMKIQGVSPEYVRGMQATGLRFDSDALVGMKIQGVTPEYVNAMKNAGFKDLDADEVIGAKIQGVTPEFIEKAKSHGFKDLDLDKLIQLKNAGVL
ncbi:peptidase M56, BlaR1 [Candidatus Koribacter versatilis Ellin345]|uniref:Peptidase M56, BlaR1 n=1 Tax=Koribacter versatilis (strain Ellin345) TaxID=204669 RepID=Q1IV86_KORVE|nr:M56 family metallopeptidase [Candidatus Koribacter versatilis]ABF39214.1 peptidase M56, BlaR1 [Candidatus Koribacter versatilis Ellin345]